LINEHPTDKFYFIIGADMVDYLPHWHKIDELIHLVKFVGVQREGFKLETSYPVIKVDVPLIDISSTMIRKQLAAHISVKYLITDSVYAYIKENRLYEN